MKNHYQEVKINSEKNFGLFFSIIFFGISFWPLLDGDLIRYWSLFLAIILLIVSLLAPRILRPFNFLWFSFGLLLNKIVSKIILAVLFFLIITPTSIIIKIFTNNFFKLHFDKSLKSYWEQYNKKDDTMKNQF